MASRRFKSKVPSLTQAKMIARLFGEGEALQITFEGREGGKPPPWNPPTFNALVKEGWIEPNGVFGTHPSGAKYQEHTVSLAGLLALETFLADQRFKTRA
jgi:hypothetical protein